MREIKFRVWDNTTNAFLESFTVYQYGNVSSDRVWLQSSEAVVEQYTGLKDKNGVEIYEGDILKNTKEGFMFKIQWGMPNESYAGWAGNWLSKDFITPMFNKPLAACERIGNIHENPELIKAKTT